MSPLAIAREKVIAAALALAGSRIQIDVSEPGPYDDASMELLTDILDQAIGEYAEARLLELKGSDQG